MGELAFCILIILAFVAFIFWARSTAGRTTLKKAYGDPHSLRKRQRLTRKHAPTAPKPAAPKRTSR